jgi:nucleotide exchange factor SIL1
MSLIGAFYLMLTLVAASSPSAASASPAADVNLICHTDNPSDCYPKVFVPTDEFQTVRDDQDLPPGLHVRLNIWTGQKEAKINVPDEQNSELEGLPVDTSVVVVDQPDEEEIQIPAGAPVYEAVGKIKEPPKSEESDSFYESLDILGKGLDIDQSLEQLEELSHDIYYGLKIAEKYETVKSLLCYAVRDDDASAGRAKMAANTLAGALQNNAKALAELERHWPRLKGSRCAFQDGDKASDDDDLTRLTFRFRPSDAMSRPTGTDPAIVRARVAALKGLLKSDVVRQEFLQQRGMENLLDLLVSLTDAKWDTVREKTALLVQDIFLDGELGAALGEWPVDDQHSEDLCAQPSVQRTLQECWDYEARKLAQEHRSQKGHWSKELWDKLREARKGVKAKQRWRDEL